MTTKAELHELVERLAPETWDDVAAWLRERGRDQEGRRGLVHSETDGLPLPASLGLGEGPGDMGRNADRYLAEGFGR
ncbi:hypothetical protein [Streptomyces sp. 6N223]|uniref:hypothetical protein n=1 Tax=Streptomyces sp. 6N223 TaxID=3457412 RepID=UPI003FD299A7